MLFLSLLLSLLGKLISRKSLWHNELQTRHPSEKCLNPSKKCLFPSKKCLADKSIQEDHQGLFRGGLIHSSLPWVPFKVTPFGDNFLPAEIVSEKGYFQLN